MRSKNLEILQENDEILQKIEIYKNSSSNSELKKNISQLNR